MNVTCSSAQAVRDDQAALTRAAQRTSAAPALSPRAVTRGEKKTDQAKVDWLNATFAKPALSESGFIALFGRMLGRPVTGQEGGGLLGFKTSIKLFAHHGATKSAMGFLAFGGESQNGRWLLSLTAVGCGFVKDWPEMADFLESLDAKITRLDLAVDFLDGEHSVDEAVSLYEFGGFSLGKNSPSSRIDGDWLNGIAGRTLYVGKAQNGKMLRVYEKGRQLGDPESEWVRFEVQLGSRDRLIPYQAMVYRDEFFAGCYPALASMLEQEGTAIPTMQAKARTTLAHLWHHLKRCYGKTIDALVTHTGAPYAELIEEVRVIGLPSRLDHSSAAAGVTWADVLAQVEKRKS